MFSAWLVSIRCAFCSHIHRYISILRTVKWLCENELHVVRGTAFSLASCHGSAWRDCSFFCQEQNRTEDIKVAWDFMLGTALQAEKKLIISICGNWGYSICCFPMSSILLPRLVGVWRSGFNDNRRSYNPVQLSVFDNHISIFHINNIQLSEWTHQLLSTNNRLSNECLSTMHPRCCRDVIGSPIGQTSKEGAGLI